MTDVTRILNALEQGDANAADELLPLVYEELRVLAKQKMAHEKPGQTLQATALVHEAYIRLLGGQDQNWNSHGHFFAAAAEAMRRILVENARRKQRLKYGGEHRRVELDYANMPLTGVSDDLIALDEALVKLADVEKVQCDLVKLRFFAGLSNEQAAKILGISEPTAKRYWRYARAWLFREVRSHD